MAISPFTTPRASISGPSVHQATVPPPAVGSSSAPARTTTPAPPEPLTVLKPVGIVNEQNTCFLNSTFQALSATAPLISILNSSPDSPFHPSSTSHLPRPSVSPNRIPCLQPETLETPLYDLLPVTRAFSTSVQKAWQMKDAGGGTYGAGETSSTRSMTLRLLLKEMAKKYDQYDDYAQQDSHELLRHLLDSMEMEEKDAIKRLQPMPPLGAKRRRSRMGGEPKYISPLQSPLPSPGVSSPPSPIKKRSLVSMANPLGVQNSRSSSMSSTSQLNGAGGIELPEILESERMVPFVDVLFGGSLASVVVCENCKSVSHTYEGFLDISLSLKSDSPRHRKRDRLKAMAQRLRPGKSSGGDTHHSSSTHPSKGAVVSDTELSDTEPKIRDRRASLDQNDRPGEAVSLSRNSSTKGFSLKSKTSFSFRRRGSKPSSTTSLTALPAFEPDKPPPVKSAPSSPSISSQSPYKGIGPTPAQSAYIQRILADPRDEHEPSERLRRANCGEAEQLNVPVESGLVESLKAFTSVEVLEGENAFACKKCWKVKTGRYKSTHATVQEEDEADLVASPSASPGLTPISSRTAPPSISIVSSDSASNRALSPIPVDGDTQIGRYGSSPSRGLTSGGHPARIPSPLGKRLDDVELASVATTELASVPSTETVTLVDPEYDGLSDTDTTDEEPPKLSELSVGRPKMPPRKKSSHFVMHRAFKRYLIAKAPEVLVFHFKRFRQTHKTGLTFTSFYDLKKMDDFVSFPEMLDLAPYLAPNRNDYKVTPTSSGPRAPYMDWASPEQGPELEPVLYRLYGTEIVFLLVRLAHAWLAVVVHLGTMIGGHYIAYCLVDPQKMFEDPEVSIDGMAALSINGSAGEKPQSKEDNRVWCFCSDTSIRLASVEEVLKAKAYLCFYEKVQTS